MNPIQSEPGREARPVAVITGAARGIGWAIAVELSRMGYDIAAIDIAWERTSDSESARGLMEEISGNGARLLPLVGDIADLDGHAMLVDSILDQLGRMDLLVNNAGVSPLQRRDILDVSPQSYDRVLATNLRGSFFFTQRIAHWILGARTSVPNLQPCIVFITSISASTISLNRAEYCISKAGLSMCASLYAARLAHDAVPVYEIRPGIIFTPMTAPVHEQYDRLIAEGLVPQERWGYPEDVARAVGTLAAGALSFSTGAVIEVSGGMNIRRL